MIQNPGHKLQKTKNINAWENFINPSKTWDTSQHVRELTAPLNLEVSALFKDLLSYCCSFITMLTLMLIAYFIIAVDLPLIVPKR